MAEYKVQDTSLTAVADAIREKAGSSEQMTFPTGFVEAIAGISAGGGDVQVNGMNLLSGEFTISEDVNSGLYDVKIGTYKSIPQKYFLFFYLIDGFPNNGAEKHIVGGASYMFGTGSSFDSQGVLMVSKGIAGVDPMSDLNYGYMPQFKALNITLRIQTSTYPLKAGSKYGWVFMHN